MGGVDPNRIKSLAENNCEFSTRLLTKLIKTPSFSGREGQIASILEQEFARCGADEVIIDGLGNVIARLGSKGPVIAFDGHMDTVNIGRRNKWGFDPFSGEIKNGRVHGRGSTDQKGGLASMVTSLKILKELYDDFPFTLFFVATVQEEDCDGLCWQYIIKENKIVPDVVVLTEPTNGKIFRGHRGRMDMEILLEGTSCHGSTPELGDNAIYKISPILKAIEKLNKHLPTDPFLGKSSIVATRVRSSAPSLNAIADFAGIYLDRRLTGKETPGLAKAQMESLMEIQVSEARVVIPTYEVPSWKGTTYPTLKTYPSWQLDISHHLLDYASRCHKGLFGTIPEIDKWSFSTNGVATKGMFDIPTFGYGPGEEKMAHAPNESIAIDDLVKASAFYACFPWILTGR